MVNIAPRTPEAVRAPASYKISSGRIPRPQRVILFGPGGVGKTTLASLAPEPLVLDIDKGSSHLSVPRVEGIETWEHLRAALSDRALLEPFKTIIVDSGTKAEEYALAWTLANIPHEKGQLVQRVENYGFGKGLQHLFDTFLLLLADMDRLIDSGKNVVLVCHECVNDAPNPQGEDFQRYEPRLQSPKSGKASIRDRVFEWADWVGYVAYDVVSQDGKARGNGTRTVYFDARPTWRAKGRGDSAKVIPWNDRANGKEVWSCLS
mgnify:CR=1 FL=1